MSGLWFRLQGRFGRFTLDAQAKLPSRGLTALVGASGSGKTTLLRCLAGLARAHGVVEADGEVWQDEHRFLPTHRRGVGVVFQEPSLLAHLTVRGNLEFAARRARVGDGPGFDETVRMFGLVDLLGRTPEALSGGERQRTAIARAILSRPRLLLMDEPLSSLDSASKAEVAPCLEELHRALDLPVLYVTHDAVEVATLADRVLEMEGGRLGPPTERSGQDPLDGVEEARVRALARAALAAGLEAWP